MPERTGSLSASISNKKHVAKVVSPAAW